MRTNNPTEVPRPQLSYADFVLDLDMFEGKTDAEILSHLKYLATNATEGQLMTACGLSLSVEVSYTRMELMNVYIGQTIATIQRLRS